MAKSMQVVLKVEAEIIELLSDADHFLRTEAIRALAYSDSPNSLQAIRDCLLDNSPSVRDVAEQTLQWFAQQDPAEPLVRAELQYGATDLPPSDQVPS